MFKYNVKYDFEIMSLFKFINAKKTVKNYMNL